MRRAHVPLLACLLALLTAGAILRAEAVLTSAPPAFPPARSQAAEAAVRRFYAAVNAALADGDLAPLRDVVAPGFVAHAPRPDLSPDRAGLERELADLRAAAPGLRLTVTTVLADGDRVVAQVSEAGAPTAFLGLPLPPRPALWGAVDRFRVADGRVAERWADAERGWLAPLLAAPLRLYPPHWRVATLERRTYAPGGRADLPAVGPRLLYVERGRLAVAALGAPGPPGTSESGALGAEVTLAPGEAVVVPEGAPATVRNPDTTDAATLEVAIEPPATVNPLAVPRPAATPTSADADLFRGLLHGVAARPLAGGVSAPLPVGEGVLALGRIALRPGASLPSHPALGGALLAVEAGTLEVTTSEGNAWRARGADGSRKLGPVERLARGDGAFVAPGAVAAFRNAGEAPLVLLVATLAPTGSPTEHEHDRPG